jgi:hypothetical protein
VLGSAVFVDATWRSNWLWTLSVAHWSIGINIMNKTNKFFIEALDEMFKRVGFDGFDKEFSDQDGWYSKKSWTKEESKDYKKWFEAKYVKEFKSTKKQAEKECAWFNLMYGWKVND